MDPDARPDMVAVPGSDGIESFLRHAFADDPRVVAPDGRSNRFGARGLRIDGNVFAMAQKGALAVKLPPDRVRDLAAAGTGAPLQMGARIMREWLVVADPAVWRELAAEARDVAARLT